MTVRSFLVVASLALSVLIGLIVGRGGAKEGGLASGERGAASTPIIGLALDTLKEARWARDSEAFQERARELGARVIVTAANSDDNRQIADVASLITSRVDVLVIVPHDGRAMAKGVDMARDAGIPVIAYDRLIRDSDVDLYVTFDNERVGELQAQFLLEEWAERPEPLQLVRIYGAKNDNNAVVFKKGQDNVLLPAIAEGRVVVLHEDWTEDWKPENAKRITNAALTKYGHDVDAILASNDGTAGGAIVALTEEGIAGEVLVTGQDADLVACQRIARGTQSMTIYKPVEEMATRAAELAVKMARGRPVVASATVNDGKFDVPSVPYPVVSVTRENLEETVIRDGFHSKKDVFDGLAE